MRALWVLFWLGCAAPQADTLQTLSAARFDDPDLSARFGVDGNSLILRLDNRSAAPLTIEWSELAIIADHIATPIRISAQPPIAPGARLVVRLPIVLLPTRRTQPVELVLPTVIRGVPREYHFHLRGDRNFRVE